MKRIVITKRMNDWHACLESDSSVFGSGVGPYEAVGDMVINHPEKFEVIVKAIYAAS